MTSLYTAVVTSSGDGRDGKILSSDGLLAADLAMPTALGGSGAGTNPEQLFAAGYAACFHSALRLVARRAKADVDGSEVTAKVDLNRVGAGFGLGVTLEIGLPGVAPEAARELVEAAHQVCPYSNATRGNVEVELVLV
ncbi:organic hydroperoxide resistance protein [Catellatospora tritici]|uniref:organic hydroperoxide resistance protein n=1 Tax=Catellatospora tritici TaxID=2851566 RepID=UPI001C2D72F8|nr:organic hydroperoxide resistance protein [Catellatospora tritici]MBV1854169.1 organic hydroperoxide resistance protein [Catellatospora tritici]